MVYGGLGEGHCCQVEGYFRFGLWCFCSLWLLAVMVNVFLPSFFDSSVWGVLDVEVSTRPLLYPLWIGRAFRDEAVGLICRFSLARK